jgi:hypothetical protein
MECAARFKKEEYARNHAAFRAYLRATTPQTFIRDQHGRYVPVDVPTADPPEWYARYLEECDQNPLPTDQRTGLRKSEDEWTMQKCWHATEDQWQTSRRPRHAIWG